MGLTEVFTNNQPLRRAFIESFAQLERIHSGAASITSILLYNALRLKKSVPVSLQTAVKVSSKYHYCLI